MSQSISIVDAFALGPFTGNQAGVCVLNEAADETWMQQVASEMNLAETAFLHREGEHYRLRWFTPAIEVDLCGHATLAAAHVLWTEGHLPPGETVHFQTRSGLLTASGSPDAITLDFPKADLVACDEPEGMLAALGIREKPIYIGKSFDYLVHVSSESVVRELNPDYNTLGKIKTRGVVVTSHSESGEYDFVSRFFAPAAGINEDPVTGSAHCILAPYWSPLLGKKSMRAFQASARGGEVLVELKGDRVFLGGKAVTTLRGELTV